MILAMASEYVARLQTLSLRQFSNVEFCAWKICICVVLGLGLNNVYIHKVYLL